ncbi:50S ribosomal protein L5 [Candidatus Gottesmanbacteria bacterium]|nr:50S ribosomal protein L5 [Candidatus Gottesmanbacteria bacterium]
MNKPLLLDKYNNELLPQLLKEFKLKNKMSVSRIEKIVVNIGLGEALENKNVIENASKQLMLITGQKPKVTVSKRSISTFKLRAGVPIGLKVTLRGYRMYDFLLKIIAIVLPRVRDFRGISEKSFDKVGNYSLGFSEQTIFPEINFDTIDKIRGLEITIVTSGSDYKKSHRLLELLGMPFRKGGING